MISIVMPTLNEGPVIKDALESLQELRCRGHELIVVDGGSVDQTRDLAQSLVDRIVLSEKGRGRQMNAGARLARGDALLFLHADTMLPDKADEHVIEALRESLWGRFDVRLSSAKTIFRVIGAMINLRSRATGIATGDQVIFVRRAVFHRQGGFPDIPLMEDIELSRGLKRQGPPACLRARVTTSSRRWEERGVIRTIILMWALRLAYWFGVSADRLSRAYR